MGLLVDGKWVDQWYTPDREGNFVRPTTSFREWVADEPDARFRPEAGRYHLYVSLACPWAHRTLIMRRLKGLEDAIGVSVVNPYMAGDGWEFAPYPGSTEDHIHGSDYLREVYLQADPEFTGRVTVPVLWDKAEGTIVNNESREILRMLDHAFDGIATEHGDYAPPEMLDEVEAAIDAIYEPINNGVYRCGFAGTQAAYDRAANELFAALDRWNEVLGSRRYLCGDRLTEADICMFTTLYRFDAAYAIHFKCSRRRIADYPNLWPYARDLFQTPGIAETCNLDHIREHYFWSHETINPKRIVAQAPLLDWHAPHGRERLADVAHS